MTASYARTRLRTLSALITLAIVAFVAMSWDAQARAAREHASIERTASIAHVIGLPGLAMSASSTWLRHPALASPSAGSADAPVGLDVDPAGGAIARPEDHDRSISITRAAR